MSQKVSTPLQPNLMETRIKPHYQHEGELYVQKRRHVPSDTHTVVARIIDDDMPDQHSEFFTHLSYFSISTIDADGRPWATMIVGSPTTLIHAVSKMQLNVSAVLPEGDPFVSSVISTNHATCRYFAGVGVDFSNRRRNKVSGFITAADVIDNTLNMSLITNESLGNCPKYITIRKLEYHKRNPQIGADHRNADNISLNQECRNIINQASTIILATRHTSNVSDNTSDLGLNQRGGPPGFVRVYEENGNTYIVIPDFSGNRFYQSLGNIQTDRVAGVAFPCFTTGDMLHVTGIAENIYDDEAERIMPRVTLITRIKLTGHVWIKEAINLKLLAPEQYSPYNPPVRYLAIELEKMGKPAKTADSGATLVDIKKLTQHISRFTFELEEKASFKPGGFVILDFSHLIGRTYRHMNDDNPQSINDDYVRTWTISSSPPFDPNTNTFQATNKVSCTIKHAPKGVMSSLLHSRSVNQQPPLYVKFVGVGGEFTCFDESNQAPQKILFIGGGVGFTPFLAMFEALSQTKQKVDIVVLFAGRGDEIDLLNDFISSPIVSSISIFDSTGVNAPNESGSLKIYNRRIQSSDLINVSDVTNRHTYICGPAQFMADVDSWLEEAGVKPNQIKKESFLF
jgi:ferredoxin-NADP reductase/predicted pyridoxine 5'-phosphate oxidase superfamily flavin-nucleotide-binding protein